MICCGKEPTDITTMDDPAPVFFCGECGKQGMESAFAEPPAEIAPPTRWQRFRLRLAEILFHLAEFVAPE